jgi:hypothetical protein
LNVVLAEKHKNECQRLRSEVNRLHLFLKHNIWDGKYSESNMEPHIRVHVEQARVFLSQNAAFSPYASVLRYSLFIVPPSTSLTVVNMSANLLECADKAK